MAGPISQPHPRTGADYASTLNGRWPRYINAALGVWLFVSAFVWPHTPASSTNTWIVGVLMVIAALSGVMTSVARWANTVLAIWLLFSTFVIWHYNVGTVWNNVIVAILAFIFSLIPNDNRRITSGA